jgi:hypothetical protein
MSGLTESSGKIIAEWEDMVPVPPLKNCYFPPEKLLVLPQKAQSAILRI